MLGVFFVHILLKDLISFAKYCRTDIDYFSTLDAYTFLLKLWSRLDPCEPGTVM